MAKIRRKKRLVFRKEKRLNRLIFICFIICIVWSFSKLFTKNPDIKTSTKVCKTTSSKTHINKNKSSNINSCKNIETNVLITSIGDCTLGRDYKYSYNGSLPDILNQNNNDYSYIFKNVASIFKSDDITIANLEGTFTTSKNNAKKRFTFKAPLEYAKILTLGNIEGVNLSNNHTMDYFKKGFEDTKLALTNEKINYFGENNIWTTTVKGTKFAFLGYKGFNSEKYLLNKIEMDIKKLKKENHIVIINFHWGIEGSSKPNTTQKKLAHFAIDSGADLIIGHHSHVLQGIEKYNNKLIFYSLGNFAFGGNKNPKDKDTIIAQINFKLKNNTLNSYDFKVIPCSISSVSYTNDYCPTPAIDNNKSRILKKLNSLSSNLNSNLNINDTFQNITLNN